MLGWLGNVLILLGVWLLAERRRVAWLLTIAGNAVWLSQSVRAKMPDLVFIQSTMVILAARNYWLWRRA